MAKKKKKKTRDRAHDRDLAHGTVTEKGILRDRAHDRDLILGMQGIVPTYAISNGEALTHATPNQGIQGIVPTYATPNQGIQELYLARALRISEAANAVREFLQRSTTFDGETINTLIYTAGVSDLRSFAWLTLDDLTHPAQSIIFPKVIPLAQATHLIDVAIPPMLKNLAEEKKEFSTTNIATDLAAESEEKSKAEEKNEFIKVALAAESEEKNEFIKVAMAAESEEKHEFINVAMAAESEEKNGCIKVAMAAASEEKNAFIKIAMAPDPGEREEGEDPGGGEEKESQYEIAVALDPGGGEEVKVRTAEPPAGEANDLAEDPGGEAVKVSTCTATQPAGEVQERLMISQRTLEEKK